MSFSASVTELVQNSTSPLVETAPSWVRVDLGDVATILNGYPWKSAYFNDQLGEPVIRIRDVTSGTTETKYRGEVVDGYWVEDGDLLIGMDGDFNVRVWDGGRALLNQRVCRITPDKRLYLPELLAHVLPGYLQLIHDETHSITVKHLSSKTLAEIPLPLPPLPEQRRIVAKIDSLSGRSRRARDHLDHIPRLVEKYKQAVLDVVFADLSSRAPLSEQVEPERGIPYGIVQTGDPFEGGVPTIRCGDIKRFRVARDGLKLVNPEIESGFRRTRLRGGEVLIAIRGSVGETCVVPSELVDCNISREVAMIPLRQGIVPDFIMYFLATTEAKRFILGNVKGVAQQGINLRDLKELPAPTGDTDAQREVVMRILRAFDWIDRLASEATSARRLIDRLDQAVLAKAFRGELVPQAPEDEPASVLLDRIRAERGAAPKTKRGRKAKAA